MNIVNKLLKNAFSNTAAFVVEAVVAFLMMPFVVGHLGDSSYGIWVLINAVTGYMGLFKLGFRPSINKHISEYKAHDDYSAMRVFLGATLHIYIYVSVLILITTVFVSYYLPNILDVGSKYQSIFQVLLLLAGVQSAFSLIGAAFGGVVSGYQRYEVNAGIEISVILIRTGLIIYFLPSFPDLYTLAAAHFSITILANFVTMASAKKIAPLECLPITQKPEKEILVVILKYNSISFSIAALAIIISYLDSIVVGIILPLSIITHYVVGDRLVKYCLAFLNVSTKVIAPAISELHATNKRETLNVVLTSTHKISCFIVYPILLGLFIQGEVFINLWMGEGYRDSYEIMQILAISALFIAPSQVINSYLYGIGKHKYLLYILIFEICTSVPLCILLGNIHGATGIALGISIPRAVIRSIALPLYVNKLAEQNILKIFFTGTVRVLLAATPYIIVLVWFKTNFLLESWASFLTQLLVAGMIYCIGAYIIAFDIKEKSQVRLLVGMAMTKLNLRRG